VDDSVLKFLSLIGQSDCGIPLLKDIKIDMPYQRWFHPASPFSEQDSPWKTIITFMKLFERPEMVELFAYLAGKVRTLRSPENQFHLNLISNKNRNFLLGIQHLFLNCLDISPAEDKSFRFYWDFFVKCWLIKSKEINGNPGLFCLKS
jgi:hypothetical protein